ncbi:cytochrome P450 [Striga asiatica]|uniref:Cytochrome P450 n=1 Tax=Striga asiatica TaxID=4170 RepID=A0A5A7QZ76_STRAF|nr:cytochrome P450 [Striga asiatica]
MYFYVIFTLLIIFLTQMIYLWMNPKCEGKLPPGSSGFPFIGETLQLFIPSYSPDVHPFIKKKIQRHGLLFRINVVGHNVVVSADQEFNRYIFQQEEKLVVHWYLDLFAKVFEQEFRPDGLTIHKYTRNLVLNHFGSESIRQKLLSEFEEIARKHIHSWCTQDSVEVERASIVMFAELCGKHLYTHGGESSEDFADLFIKLSRAAMSFPLNIPGTTFHKCLKDKEKALDTVRKIVIERIASPRNNHGDVLDEMVNDMKTVKFLTPEYIAQFLFSLSFAAFQTISGMLTHAVNFVTQNPAVLQELIVVNETLRLGNTAPGFLRRADVGLEFISKNLKPFGGGIKQCAGADLARASMSIFLHILVTQYRWAIVKGGVIVQNPLRHFKDGLHIRVFQRQN